MTNERVNGLITKITKQRRDALRYSFQLSGGSEFVRIASDDLLMRFRDGWPDSEWNGDIARTLGMLAYHGMITILRYGTRTEDEMDLMVFNPEDLGDICLYMTAGGVNEAKKQIG